MRVVAISDAEIVKGLAICEPLIEYVNTQQKRVARIHIVGAIVGSDLDWWGGVSTSSLASAILREASAGNDIELIIDSPGGSVVGLDEVSNAIYEAQKTVQVAAYARGLCTSAAYWIASQCKPFTASPLAVLGSIGVQLAERSDSAPGIVLFHSRNAPLKNASPTEYPEQYQALVDATEQEFLKVVAQGRGVTVEVVTNTYGQGAIVSAREGFRVGMVDQIVESSPKGEGTMPNEEKKNEEQVVDPVAPNDATDGGDPNPAPSEDPKPEEAPKDEVTELRKQLEELQKLVDTLTQEKKTAEAKAHSEKRTAAINGLLSAGKILPTEKATYEALYDKDQGLFAQLTANKQPAYKNQRESLAVGGIPTKDAKDLKARVSALAKERGISLSAALREITEN